MISQISNTQVAQPLPRAQAPRHQSSTQPLMAGDVLTLSRQARPVTRPLVAPTPAPRQQPAQSMMAKATGRLARFVEWALPSAPQAIVSNNGAT